MTGVDQPRRLLVQQRKAPVPVQAEDRIAGHLEHLRQLDRSILLARFGFLALRYVGEVDKDAVRIGLNAHLEPDVKRLAIIGFERAGKPTIHCVPVGRGVRIFEVSRKGVEDVLPYQVFPAQQPDRALIQKAERPRSIDRADAVRTPVQQRLQQVRGKLRRRHGRR